MDPFTTDRIIEKLKDLIPEVKVVFDGDPYAIALTQLPAIVVETETVAVRTGPTGMDRTGEAIVIKYIVNKRDDFGESSNTNETYRRLKRVILARDPNTRQWKKETLMYAIRKNFTLDNVLIGQDVDVQFVMAARPDDMLTAEAHVTISATELVEVSSRS